MVCERQRMLQPKSILQQASTKMVTAGLPRMVGSLRWAANRSAQVTESSNCRDHWGLGTPRDMVGGNPGKLGILCGIAHPGKIPALCRIFWEHSRDACGLAGFSTLSGDSPVLAPCGRLQARRRF